MLPIAAYLQGEYGLKDIFIGVPCHLGCAGVENLIELSLSEAKLAELNASAQAVKQNIEKVQQVLQEKTPSLLGAGS